MSASIHRLSREYCEDTCPNVDEAFNAARDRLAELVAPSLASAVGAVLSSLCDKVKEVGTEKLREALCRAISDKVDIEHERDELQERVNELEATVDNLRDDVRTLEASLDGVTL